MLSMKFLIENQIIFFWMAGFFLPAINATVFREAHFLPKNHSTYTELFTNLNFEKKASLRYSKQNGL
jgi:hypothetical protein